MVVAREKALHSAVKRGREIDSDDIDKYKRDFGNSQRVEAFKIDFEDVKGLTVSNRGSSASNSRENLASDAVDDNSYPYYSSSTILGVGSDPVDFREYTKVNRNPVKKGVKALKPINRKSLRASRPLSSSGTFRR